MADRPQINGWNNSSKPEEYSSEFVVDGNRYANVTNVTTGQRQLYYVQPLSNARGLITTTNADGTVTKGSNYDNFVQFQGKDRLTNAEINNKKQSTALLSNPKISTPTENNKIKNSKEYKSSLDNKGTPGGTDSTASADLKKELEGKSKAGTRATYENAKYPLNLRAETQDCLQITMIEYTPRGTTTTTPDRRVTFNAKEKQSITTKDRKYLGTVTLPIPGGIRDENSVSWADNSLDPFTNMGADLAKGLITGGGEGGAKSIEGSSSEVDKGSLQTTVAGKFAEAATGSTNLMQRQYGQMLNPNMELLFTGPSLRSFSFTFRMSPRSKNEAKEIKKIIRFFKQGMSVKRSESTLLLRSPHTFAISYVTSNKQHPYLNKFKECALQTCSVNYTPDGNYMTYAGEPSMTAYELSLSFKELEPIFDDDYGDGYDNIGF